MSNKNLKVLADNTKSSANLIKQMAEENLQIDPEVDGIIPDTTGENPDENGLIAKQSTVSIDGDGALNILPEDINDPAFNILNDQDRKIQEELDKVVDSVTVSKEEIRESLKATFDFVTPDELDTLCEVVNRIQLGEDFSIYNNLPKSVQEYLTTFTQGITDSRARKMVAKEYFLNIVNEIKQYKAYDVLMQHRNEKVDEIIKEEMNTAYAEYFNDQKKVMIEGYIKKAEALEELGTEEALRKAGLCRNISFAYVESYELNEFKEAILSSPGKFKAKKIQLQKFERECESFNAKYYRSKFDMISLDLIEPILLRHLNENYPEKEYTDLDVKKFLLAFIKFTLTYSPENLVEHAFMFYFVCNIAIFDNMTSENDKNHISTMLSNIVVIIDKLREMN